MGFSFIAWSGVAVTHLHGECRPDFRFLRSARVFGDLRVWVSKGYVMYSLRWERPSGDRRVRVRNGFISCSSRRIEGQEVRRLPVCSLVGSNGGVSDYSIGLSG